jgi:hypothetical protein
LSLVIVKLMGAGEYVAELPGDSHAGHFGLSVKDYTHATAPNRRFADLVTQRLLKAALADHPSPYGIEELSSIAGRCTVQEGNIAKVERQVHKSAAVLLLEKRVGESFDGLVTGAADKGTWVRIIDPPAEGGWCRAPRDCTWATSFARPLCRRISSAASSTSPVHADSPQSSTACFYASGKVIAWSLHAWREPT